MTGSNASTLQIAIVGSGIAGSAAAYFLRQALPSSADIVVFERDSIPGGRVRSLEIGGITVEAGASLIHTSNQYLVGFADTFQLAPAMPHNRTSASQRRIGIWNGRTFSAQTASSPVRTLMRMLVRYQTAPLRIRTMVRSAVNQLGQIYALQALGQGFDTPEALFRRLDLFALTQVSAYEFFRGRRIGERFIREFANGISRANYGQDASINAFCDLISLAGAGYAGGLFSLRGGNHQVIERLLSAARADVRLGTPVRQVTLENDEDGIARYRLSTEAGEAGVFDGIIVAAPLEFANLAFSGVPLPDTAVIRRDYQTTHATFVHGTLNPAFFGLPPAGEAPELILTEEREAILFSSIAHVGRAAGGEAVYKIFSRVPVHKQLLDRLFASRQHVEPIPWRAYPVLKPTRDWPPFTLHAGLYYVNAMETPVSTMETEAIGAKNAANLLASYVSRTRIV